MKNNLGFIKGILNYQIFEPNTYLSHNITTTILAYTPDVERYGQVANELKLEKYAPDGKLVYIKFFEAYKQGKGIGTDMLNRLIELENPDMIFLEAWSEEDTINNATFNFYQNRGFLLRSDPEIYQKPLMIWEK